jgi:FkbM family methyltransferase
MNKIIFDLGFHDGTDTDLYLSKGFEVAAVEANPVLCEAGRIKFNNRNLFIYNNIISNKPERELPFYVNLQISEWSSIFRYLAEQDGRESKEIMIPTITLTDLYQKHGTPHYIKCDVEGCDIDVLQQLYFLDKPQYVSFELSRTYYLEIFFYLKACGYTKFQLRNQMNNKDNSSGDFGEFLPEHEWKDIDETLKNYMKFNELRSIDYRNLSFGWMDIHGKI